ncbi:MAG: methionine--tRNA ligase [Actinobacteria bacterium]|nr:methionine--tRNA ligase [Actinomycetota bacterium]
MQSFYITTPIYYVNDAPHIGHAYTMVIADALARLHRMMGDDVYFVTGTDEHGRKVAEAACEHGVAAREWTDRMSARFREAWTDLDISNDDFIRTTEERHYTTVQSFFRRIKENGYISKDVYRGPYCVACESYYEESELDNGNCPYHGRPVEEMEEENYFFELPALEDRLLEWYERNPDAVVPATKRNEAVGFIKSGLKHISITRTSLTWGVPVPWDSGHVFYVWSDALVNYLTAIGYGSGDGRLERFWPVVHHVIGKDILRFHCVWWPAMCIAAGLEPPSQVLVHGWLLVSGEKMSKSRLNQIAPGDLTGDFGVDPVRYHLLRDVSLGADGDFSYEGMVERYNADLANNLGNLLARVVAVVNSKCGGIGPVSPGVVSRGTQPSIEPRAGSGNQPAGGSTVTGPAAGGSIAVAGSDALSGAAAELAGKAGRAAARAMDSWSRSLPHDALREVWELIRDVNSALETVEPWRKEPGIEVDNILGAGLEALRVIALLVAPAMPSTADEIWRRIGLTGSPDKERLPDALQWGGYPGGLQVIKGPPLFPRITR